MDPNNIFPGSQGQPLFQVSPDRVNRKNFDVNGGSPKTHSRDSSVAERAAKFDTLAFQGKALERKANDAALKRAMLGREEAESEMRRYRDEARVLRKQVEDLASKSSKLEERNQGLTEKYARAKETHQHTEKLWNDQIRRARKEAFKSSSMVVKLQEELKSSRSNLKMAQTDFDTERERSSKREQEAFAARYQLVGVQEELASMKEKVKLIEQERDALRTVAKNEEVARIAAEGRIPLPDSKDDDEFASPRRKSEQLPLVTVLSSAASEEEIESLRWDLKLEKQRAERAFEHAEFMKMECHFGRCTCRLSEKNGQAFVQLSAPSATESKPEEKPVRDVKEEEGDFDLYSIAPHKQSEEVLPSTQERKPIFIPEEGTFRMAEEPVPQSSPWISPAKTQSHTVPIPPMHTHNKLDVAFRASVHARTPSCEPPSFAQIADTNTSLLSLIDGSQNPPTVDESDEDDEPTVVHHDSSKDSSTEETYTTPEQESPAPRTFHTISTTTRIPLADPDASPAHQNQNQNPAGPRPAPAPITHSASHPIPNLSQPSFDATNSALSPTMTREEALAMIRERRGRARSLANGTMTPRKQMVDATGSGASTGGRRDISAPAVRSAPRSVSRGRGLLNRS